MEKEFHSKQQKKSSGKRPVKDRYGEYMVENVAHHHQQSSTVAAGKNKYISLV